MPLVLFCRRCGAWFSAQGTVPAVCPSCTQETTWSTMPEPTVPYVLTPKDRRLLQLFHIARD